MTSKNWKQKYEREHTRLIKALGKVTDGGWKFVTPFEKRLEPWPPHMRLELPRHQVHAHRVTSLLIFY